MWEGIPSISQTSPEKKKKLEFTFEVDIVSRKRQIRKCSRFSKKVKHQGTGSLKFKIKAVTPSLCAPYGKYSRDRVGEARFKSKYG